MDERVELLQTTARRAGFKGLAVIPQTAFTAWERTVHEREGYEVFKVLPGLVDARPFLPEAKSIVIAVWDYSGVAVPPSYRGRVARLYLSRSDLPDHGGHPAGRAMQELFARLGWRFTPKVPRREAAAAAGLLVQRRNCLGYLPGGHSFVALFAWAVDAPLAPWRAWFDGKGDVACPTVTEPLQFTYPPERRDPCGDCRLCLYACPTGALRAPFVVDPRRCIDHNNSSEGHWLPPELRPKLGSWVYGCDACQEACPHNKRAVRGGGAGSSPDEWPELSLERLATVTPEEYQSVWSRLFIFNADRDDLRRNALVALGNLGDPATVRVLRAALGDPNPFVRGHAAWALGRLPTPVAGDALSTALDGEPDPTVRDEIALALVSGVRAAGTLEQP